MTEERSNATRRSVLMTLGAAGALGLAGCQDDDSPGTNTSTATPRETETVTTPVDRETAEPNEDGPEDQLPSREEGVEQWGQRLNDHAREAAIDWTQFADEDITLTFGMALHPYSTTTEVLLSYFEDLTGIEVEYQLFTEEQLWLEVEQFITDQSGEFDGIMNGLWPAGGYHEQGAVRDLKEFINDPTLTDKDWLHLEDFREDTKRLLTFPGQSVDTNRVDGFPDGAFVGFPNSIEVHGCVGYHKPTYEQLGLAEPTDFEELRENARHIAEQTDRAGIVSRTSTDTLSSANWGTMFKTYQADWINRETKEARLNSERGVESLELFADMLRSYGPENPGTRDWYANNNTYSEEDVGMIYSSPQTSFIIDRPVMQETKWLPPLKSPYGDDPVVNTWVWSTAISTYSENPEAAWLFIQWANSREANFMLSTKTWRGDDPRAGYARLDYVDQRDNLVPIPGEGYMNAFREGLSNVPDPSETPPKAPPVPADTPQCMNIMDEVSQAMSSVVSGDWGSQEALDRVAPQVTDYAEQIPDRYIAYLQ